jgi:bilirubin oxidase
MGKKFLGLFGCSSALVLLFLAFGPAPASAQLDPATIPKYVTPLAIPPIMPVTSELPGGIAYYEVAARQISQQVLPEGFPMTTVWGYGSAGDLDSFSSPGPTFEVTVDTPVRVKWINDLKSLDGTFIPHLFSTDVDQTLHWANPPQDCADGTTATDCVGSSQEPYLGPVPIVTHLHGSHVTPESDGYPEAWYLPAANDIPNGYAAQGSHFGQIAGAPVEPGAAVFQYSNDQRATTLWYHDHSLGITRLNNYAGLAGFYLIRGGASDLSAGVLPEGSYEIPLVVQERSFLDDGSLNFSSPNGDGDGDTMVVNGKTWPFLEVEPRRYRFRLLNGSNNNPIDLELATDNTPGDNSIDDGGWTGLTDPFRQIGADGGFLPAPVEVQQLILHPAERADVIVDFSIFAPGDILYLVNDGGDPGTTEQVLKIVVVDLTTPDTSTPVNQLALPTFTPLGPATNVRQVSLNMGGAGQPEDLLGTVDPVSGLGIPLLWMDAITENPRLGSTEIWEIHNFSGDDHPIHLHQVQFEIIDRRTLGTAVGDPSTTLPEPGETGTKDTVIVGNNEIARVKAKFDIPGLFVWHCHILDHEDDEMMRPYYVTTPTVQDALRALQIAVGIINPTADDLLNLDVAPLIEGVSTPDGVIDIIDALLILRMAIGLIDF